MFAYLIAYVGVKRQIWLVTLSTLISVIYSLNLYLPYSYYEPLTNPLKNVLIEEWITRAIPGIALIQLGVFVVLVFAEDITKWLTHYFQLGNKRKIVSQ